MIEGCFYQIHSFLRVSGPWSLTQAGQWYVSISDAWCSCMPTQLEGVEKSASLPARYALQNTHERKVYRYPSTPIEPVYLTNKNYKARVLVNWNTVGTYKTLSTVDTRLHGQLPITKLMCFTSEQRL